MKMNLNSLRKCFLALIVSGFFVSAQASSITPDDIGNKEVNFSFEQTEAKGTVVINFFNISTTGSSVVTVNTKGGRKIFEESLHSQKTIARKYDFSHLKPGKYVFTLENEDKKISKPIIVGLDGSFREDKSHLFVNFKPVVIAQKDQVQVMFENKTDENMKVRLITEEGEVLYTEHVAGFEKYGKSISIEKLPAGSYMLEVSCPDYRFTKTVAHKSIR